MEPPSAAVYFFHLKFFLCAFFVLVFICILERSSSLLKDTHSHTHPTRHCLAIPQTPFCTYIVLLTIVEINRSGCEGS